MTLSKKEEFRKRLQYNTELFKKQLKYNKFTPSLYYLIDKKPKELSSLQYCRKSSEIWAAAVVGALCSSEMTGTDAYIMRANKINGIELKTSYISHKKIFKTSNNKIYTYPRLQLENSFRGRYAQNSYDPEIDDYLICCDTSGKWNTEVIGVWKLSGKMGQLLLNEGITAITLKKFQIYGKQLDGRHLNHPIIGWNTYVNTLLKRLPIKKLGANL